MKKCNICGHRRPQFWYKTKDKKTCRSCERGWRGWYYRHLVQQRQLTLFQRTASRIGYMGAGFLMAGQWTVEPLVILQLNGLIAWTLHFIKTLN